MVQLNKYKVCVSQALNNKLLYNELKECVSQRFEEGNQSICSTCSSSSLSLPHLCVAPHSPLISLNFSRCNFTKQASTDVVQIPPCGTLVQPAVSAGVEGRGQRREARLPQLHQIDPRTCAGRDEGEVAVEGTGRRDGLGEAAREQEGVRNRLDC